ncbi:MAG: lycopene cyclase domain-containing protein [Flavobacteriaceae bacterium]|nr:lycopene cyclase domain-containing protein [Flavobacteriaceae bacterium]
MKSLYLILNLASISVPFIVSFHPRLKFYKKWKSILLAIIITTAFFISWDVIFTKNGFWGFNPEYYLGHTIAQLPIEEWMFFICIPYSCLFMHYALLELNAKLVVPKHLFKKIATLFILILLVLTGVFYHRWYSFVNFGYGFILTTLVYRFKPELLRKFFITFLFMLIPFFIVNGILTGSGIESEVVWYNNSENLGIRMLTIPVEDTIYAFTMILTNLVLLEYFEKK